MGNWWFGPNSLWGKYGPDEVGFAGVTASWGDAKGSFGFGDKGKAEGGTDDIDGLKIGAIALLVYLMIK